MPSRRVPCLPGEKVDEHDDEGLVYRGAPGAYAHEMKALEQCVEPALEHVPCSSDCSSGVCGKLEQWRLWNWDRARVMTLAEEHMFCSRREEWTTEETWRAKIHVREQLTREDYLEAHRLEGTESSSPSKKMLRMICQA